MGAVFITAASKRLNQLETEAVATDSDILALWDYETGAQKAITAKHFSANSKAYATKAALKAATGIPVGTRARVTGEAEEFELTAGAPSEAAGDSQGVELTSAVGAGYHWRRLFSGPINVKWFGAVADCPITGVTTDATDNKLSIQAALNYAASNPGTTVYIPEGCFGVSGTLEISSFTSLIGYNRDRSIIRLLDSSGLTENDGVLETKDFLAGRDYWKYDPDSPQPGVHLGITLDKFTIDGNSDNNSTGCGLRMYGGRFLVPDIAIHHCADHGIWTEVGQAETVSTGGTAFYNHINMHEAWFGRIQVSYTGKNGWLFYGPNDTWIDHYNCKAAGWAAFYHEDDTDIKSTGLKFGTMHAYICTTADAATYPEQATFYFGAIAAGQYIYCDAPNRNGIIIADGNVRIGMIYGEKMDLDMEAESWYLQINSGGCYIGGARFTDSGISGKAWLPGRAVTAGLQRNRGDNVYICTTGGTTASVTTGTGLRPSAGGTGYSTGTGVATTTSGSGTGLTVDIVTIDASTGEIYKFDINAGGSGYAVGDVITISTGGANATYTLKLADFVGPTGTGTGISDGTAVWDFDHTALRGGFVSIASAADYTQIAGLRCHSWDVQNTWNMVRVNGAGCQISGVLIGNDTPNLTGCRVNGQKNQLQLVIETESDTLAKGVDLVTNKNQVEAICNGLTVGVEVNGTRNHVRVAGENCITLANVINVANDVHVSADTTDTAVKLTAKRNTITGHSTQCGTAIDYDNDTSDEWLTSIDMEVYRDQYYRGVATLALDAANPLQATDDIRVRDNEDTSGVEKNSGGDIISTSFPSASAGRVGQRYLYRAADGTDINFVAVTAGNGLADWQIDYFPPYYTTTVIVDRDTNNGSMDADVTGHTFDFQASITHQTSGSKQGAGHGRVLADAATTGTHLKGYSAVLTNTKRYLVAGWAKSDGTETPIIQLGSTGGSFTGSTSTSWQRVLFIGTNTGTTDFRVGFSTAGAAAGTEYVEFDDLQVFELPN